MLTHVRSALCHLSARVCFLSLLDTLFLYQFTTAVMYGCESWTIKKAEHRRTDAFELRFWGGLLRIPWTARRSNQSILKKINSEYSLEGLVLKRKL